MAMPRFKTKEEVPQSLLDSGEYGEDKETNEWVHLGFEELKRAHERQKTEAKTAKEQAAAAERRAREIENETKQKKAGLTDEQIAAQRLAEEEAQKPLKEALEKANNELRKLKLEDRVKKHYADAGFKGDKLSDAYELTKDQYDLNESGTPILKANPTADLAKHAADVIAKKYPEWVLSKQKGGAEFVGGDGKTFAGDTAKLVTAPGGARQLIEMANDAK